MSWHAVRKAWHWHALDTFERKIAYSLIQRESVSTFINIGWAKSSAGRSHCSNGCERTWRQKIGESFSGLLTQRVMSLQSKAFWENLSISVIAQQNFVYYLVLFSLRHHPHKAFPSISVRSRSLQVSIWLIAKCFRYVFLRIILSSNICDCGTSSGNNSLVNKEHI